MTRNERDKLLVKWWANLHPKAEAEEKPEIPIGYKRVTRHDGSFTVYRERAGNVWYPTNMNFFNDVDADRFIVAVANSQ